MRISPSFQFAQGTVHLHMTISSEATTRTPLNSRKPVHQCVLCSCGARLESNDALIDHQDWCLGSGRANARLMEKLRQRGQDITYETLVGAERPATARVTWSRALYSCS
jgi:hypothetical protein